VCDILCVWNQLTYQPCIFCAEKIAAGKSTLARRLAARPATLLISEDHWMSNLFSTAAIFEKIYAQE
jgi:predicted kinase